MHEALGGQIALSAVVVFLIQFAKNSQWPALKWVHGQSDRLNRWLAVALSGLTALGIHWAYDAGFSWTEGGNIIIAWPGLLGIGHAGWEWLQSFAMQEWLYRSSVKA